MMKYESYLDFEKGKKVIQILYDSFYSGDGLFEVKNNEDLLLLENIKAGSEEHLVWITLTSTLDYSRDADRLWKAGDQALQDKDKRWIFDPNDSRIENYDLLKKELMTPVNNSTLKIAQRNDKDTKAWQTVLTSIRDIMKGSMTQYIKEICSNDAIILYFNVGIKYREYFPFLSGPKILAMWIRLMNKYGKLNLKNMNIIPLPVDIHVARSTIHLCGKGNHKLSMDDIKKGVNLFWEDIAQELNLQKLDFDELLFFLSKEGCKLQSKERCKKCIVKEYCIGIQDKAKISQASGIVINNG